MAVVRIFGLVLTLLLPQAPKAMAATNLSFTVQSVSGFPGDQALVAIQVAGFSEIQSLQFSFHWNPAQAAFIDVEQYGLFGLTAGDFGFTRTNSGTLIVSWDDPAGVGQSLPDGTMLFVVRLLLIGPAGTSGALSIDGNPTFVLVSNSALEVIPATLNPGVLTLLQPTIRVDAYAALELVFGTQANHSYQVQYVTNVNSTSWVNLGAPVSGTGANASVFDSARGGPRRFYRVMRQ